MESKAHVLDLENVLLVHTEQGFDSWTLLGLQGRFELHTEAVNKLKSVLNVPSDL